MSFCINCFEEALIFLKCDVNKWMSVLEDLWTFTSIEFLDDWSGLIAEILPKCILEFNDYNDNYEYIDEEKYHYLHALYQNIDARLEKIIDYIFHLGESHAYSVIINSGPESLNALQKLIDHMNKNSLPMPDIEKYKFFSINENKGWGNRFDGKTLSIIL